MNAVTHYFLGANTHGGFRSLYGNFAAPDDFLFVIKGGPGCGKSTFMRQLGQALEAEGCAVEYVHCSGDPDSLDGVRFPEMHIAYMDGTAPHVTEPELTGVTGQYLDLGGGYDCSLLQDRRAEFRLTAGAYKAAYADAYMLLHGAWCIRESAVKKLGEDGRIFLETSAADNVRDNFRPGPRREIFLSAVTGQGLLPCLPDARLPTQRLIRIIGAPGLVRAYMGHMAGQAEKLEAQAVICRDPLDSEQVEHVLFPDLDGFVSGAFGASVDTIAVLDLDRIVGTGSGYTEPPLFSAALEAGCRKLAEAKALHDTLEQMYRPYVDFSHAQRLCSAHLRALMKRKNME